MSRTFTSFEGVALKLMMVGALVEESASHGLEQAAKLIETTAKDAIGTYEFGWAPLGPAAIAKHGDTPLLDTGDLKESIEHTVGRLTADVGTNSPIAAFQELGTVHIPARPFMEGALNAKSGELGDVIGKATFKAFES